jgi:hypothetical protein
MAIQSPYVRRLDPWKANLGLDVPEPVVQPPVAPTPEPTRTRNPIDPNNPGISESERYFKAMQEARSKRPFTDRYQGLLEAPPQRSDYKPSGWRALGAGLIGASHAYQGNINAGIDAGDKFMSMRYDRAMGDYGENLKRAGAQAGIEQQDIQDTMGVMKDAASLGLDYNKYMELVRNNKAENQTAQDRIDLDYDKMIADGYERTYDLDGSVVYTNPITNDRKRFNGINSVESVNAATNIRNADTNAGRARTEATESAARIKQRDRALDQGDIRLGLDAQDLELKSDLARRSTPQQQSTAYMQALREIQADPAMGEYVKFNEQTGDIYVLTDKMSDEEYDLVVGEIEDRYNEILETATGAQSSRRRLGTPPTPTEIDNQRRARGLQEEMRRRRQQQNEWFRIPTRDYNQGVGQ